jgi:hypothetical protein
MNANIGKDIKSLIAAANKRKSQMVQAGYREEIVNTTYADAINFIKSQYQAEMDARIAEEEHKKTMIRKRYEDKVKESLPNGVELELHRSRLKTMTDTQLHTAVDSQRLGNTKDTFFQAWYARELGAECRHRGMKEDADSLGVFCEVAHIDDPALSDPDYKTTVGNIEKLTVLKNQCAEGNMFVLPVGNSLTITQKDILPFNKLSEVV